MKTGTGLRYLRNELLHVWQFSPDNQEKMKKIHQWRPEEAYIMNKRMSHNDLHEVEKNQLNISSSLTDIFNTKVSMKYNSLLESEESVKS